MTKALRTHEGLDEAPAPRTLVEAIEPEGVRLRSYFWFASRGVDRGKLMSDAQLTAKAALQKVGIRPAPRSVIVQTAKPERSDRPEVFETVKTGLEAIKVDDEKRNEKLQEDMRIDANAAMAAASQEANEHENEVGHALSIAGPEIDGEGRNLLGKKRGSDWRASGPWLERYRLHQRLIGPGAKADDPGMGKEHGQGH